MEITYTIGLQKEGLGKKGRKVFCNWSFVRDDMELLVLLCLCDGREGILASAYLMLKVK